MEEQKIFACVLKNFIHMEDFALAELKSLLLMYSQDLKQIFKYEIPESEFPQEIYQINRKLFKNYPMIKLNYQNVDHLKEICKSSVGISFIFEYMGNFENYEQLFKDFKAENYPQYFRNKNAKLKLHIEGINKDYKDNFRQEIADQVEANFKPEGQISLFDENFSIFVLEIHKNPQQKLEQYVNNVTLLEKYEKIQQKLQEQKQKQQEQQEQNQEQKLEQNLQNKGEKQQINELGETELQELKKEIKVQNSKDKLQEELSEQERIQFQKVEEKKQKYMTEEGRLKRQQKLEKNKQNKINLQDLEKQLLEDSSIIDQLKNKINNYQSIVSIHFGICYIKQRENKRLQKYESVYNLVDRAYLGPTSTEAKLAFLMANQGQVKSDSFVYDPFCGSGSLLIPPTHFGATVFGTDLDSRVIQGCGVGRLNEQSQYAKENYEKLKDYQPKIMINFDQYKLKRPEILRMDCMNTAFQFHEFFDAVICDPPYGIKAMTKKSGKEKSKKDKTSKYENKEEFQQYRQEIEEKLKIGQEKENQEKSSQDQIKLQRYAPTQQTSVLDLVQGLYDLSYRVLNKGGRLVFLFPVKKQDLEKQGMDIIPKDQRFKLRDYSYNDLQGNIQRILVTMIKV